jgi:plasmid replication initiation protein
MPGACIVPMSHAEAGRLGGLKRQAGLTPEQRSALVRKASLAAAVKTLTNRAGELSELERQRLAALFAAPGGGEIR